MPNKKQKRLMREEKRRRATADKESAELAANQFDDQYTRQLGQEADQRGEPLNHRFCSIVRGQKCSNRCGRQIRLKLCKLVYSVSDAQSQKAVQRKIRS